MIFNNSHISFQWTATIWQLNPFTILKKWKGSLISLPLVEMKKKNISKLSKNNHM